MTAENSTAAPTAASDATADSSAGEPTRPPLYGRKVLSFVRRSPRLDDRLQRARDTYAHDYLLNGINAGEGSLDPRADFTLDVAYVQRVRTNVNQHGIAAGRVMGENIDPTA